jgi:hypothetical protein
MDPRAESTRYHEATEIHSRLIKCPLLIAESHAYWQRVKPGDPRPDPQVVFEDYWFGAKSLPWVKELLLNLHIRFGEFPAALAVLRSWNSMTPGTRAIICHWHLQLTDSLYRRFSGEFLVARRAAARPELHRKTVISWVAKNGRSSWTMATRKQMATRLLSVALSAGLISKRRDPRDLVFPRVDDAALEYLLNLLRIVTFAGTLLDNPYLRSVGLEGQVLESRLRKLPSIKFHRVADVVEFDWQHRSLSAWGETELHGCERAS